MKKALLNILCAVVIVTDMPVRAQEPEEAPQQKIEQSQPQKPFWKKFTPKQLALMAGGAVTTALASFALFNTFLKNQKYKAQALEAGEMFKDAPMEVRLAILLGEATSFQGVKEQVARFAALGPKYAQFVKKQVGDNGLADYTGPAKVVINHKIDNIKHTIRALSQECQKINPACIILNYNLETRVGTPQSLHETPFLIAAKAGNKKLMGELLAAGADLNARDYRNDNALNYAYSAYINAKNNWQKSYYLETMKFLLERGINNPGRELYIYGVHWYDDPAVKKLIKKYKNWSSPFRLFDE